MSDEIFTDPEEPHEEWVDVRMTDPDEGEWDVDVVVLGGRVEYVDLRVRPGLLTDFVECLVDDVGDGRAEEVVRTVVDRMDLDVRADADPESSP